MAVHSIICSDINQKLSGHLKQCNPNLVWRQEKFVSLHVRTHINDHYVFNPLNLKFAWQPMFECALKAAKILSHKMNISKVPIFLATDNQVVIY